MRVGLLSDVHCNAAAFEVAVEELSGSVDEILLLGDSVYEYRFSNEVVGRARQLGLRTILGNHEMVLLGHHGERARANPTVDGDLVRWLGEQPDRLEIDVGGKRILAIHASPAAPHTAYLYPGSALLEEHCADVDADIVLLGHTHVPMAERVGRVLVVNPGSLGESRDPSDPLRQVSYAVLDTDSEEVSHVRFPNPRVA